jgi:hypothetical protein
VNIGGATTALGGLNAACRGRDVSMAAELIIIIVANASALVSSMSVTLSPTSTKFVESRPGAAAAGARPTSTRMLR